MIARLFARPSDFEVIAMTDDHTHAASAIHATRFRRAWSEEELHALLVQGPVFGFVARSTGTAATMGGFVLARAAAGEAEILTIGVSTRHERKGLGWRLMHAAMREAASRGAEALFLEVDENNAAATALYRSLGFRQVGERKAYYDQPGGARTRALVLRRNLA